MRNLQSLRLLLADKDKEIEKLKKELTEEKNAYIKMYNMYVEKDNIINELEKYLNEQVDYMTHHSIERMVAFDCCRYKLQELKGSDSNE